MGSDSRWSVSAELLYAWFKHSPTPVPIITDSYLDDPASTCCSAAARWTPIPMQASSSRAPIASTAARCRAQRLLHPEPQHVRAA
jgi:hypothetical protein